MEQAFGTAVGTLVGFIASKAAGKLSNAILKNPDDVREAVQIIHTEALKGEAWALNVFGVYGIGADAALARDGWKTLGDAVGL
jgi:hypothetical protein